MLESAEQLILGDILCRLPLGNGHKGEMKIVRAIAFFKAKPSFRTPASRRQETESAFKKLVTQADGN